MQPRMSEAEIRLFESFLRCADRYMEFGSGGSTCLAAGLVRSSVLAVDSSHPWLTNIATHCSQNDLPIKPDLIHVDIGATGDWGYPTDPTTRDTWPSYHRLVWTNPGTDDIDLYLIDGRFRVACFMQAVLRAERNSIILFHDFRSRAHYAAVREVAREIAVAEDLSVFVPLTETPRHHVEELIVAYEFDCR